MTAVHLLIFLNDRHGRIIVITESATRGTYAMWFLDFPTLVLVIAAGLQAGLQAIFGLDAAAALFGVHANLVLCLMGISAVWQLLRQRFH